MTSASASNLSVSCRFGGAPLLALRCSTIEADFALVSWRDVLPMGLNRDSFRWAFSWFPFQGLRKGFATKMALLSVPLDPISPTWVGSLPSRKRQREQVNLRRAPRTDTSSTGVLRILAEV